MSQPNNASTRQQPTSYPSPHSYPSPSMSAYAYPSQQQQPPQHGAPQQPQQPNAETFRASPNDTAAPLPPLNLPPIRSIDQRQPPAGQVPMGSAMPPVVAPMGYYPQAQMMGGQQHPNLTSSPNNHGGMRYPIAAPDNRIMSGGRHKKEIKRRTKTGCLTCRKRRIKCDEAHPVCRNCQKSKRDCLGYDPIFKSQPGPPAIQPAPSTAPMMTGAPLIATSSPAPMTFPIPPHGYVPAINAAYPPPMSTGTSPSPSVEPYDYTSAIDPALEAVAPAPMPMPPGAFDGSQSYREEMKSTASPFSPAGSETQNLRGAKRFKIDDLLSISGAAPMTATAEKAGPITPEMYDHIKALFSTYYAPSIDKFLETTWYSNHALPRLLADRKLCDYWAVLVERFRDISIPPHDVLEATHDIERKAIWLSMNLCRADVPLEDGSTTTNGQVDGSAPSTKGLRDLVARLEIVEALITGNLLEPAKLTQLGGTPPMPIAAEAKSREHAFWGLLCKYLTLKEEVSNLKEADDTLANCRTLLDTLENRDVLYSIAIVRHIGQRTPEFPHNLQPGRDEIDPRMKLYIAKAFIEAESIKGTTSVILRICEMVVHSWSL